MCACVALLHAGTCKHRSCACAHAQRTHALRIKRYSRTNRLHFAHGALEAFELPKWPARDAIRTAQLFQRGETDAELLGDGFLGQMKVLRELIEFDLLAEERAMACRRGGRKRARVDGNRNGSRRRRGSRAAACWYGRCGFARHVFFVWMQHGYRALLCPAADQIRTATRPTRTRAPSTDSRIPSLHHAGKGLLPRPICSSHCFAEADGPFQPCVHGTVPRAARAICRQCSWISPRTGRGGALSCTPLRPSFPPLPSPLPLRLDAVSSWRRAKR